MIRMKINKGVMLIDFLRNEETVYFSAGIKKLYKTQIMEWGETVDAYMIEKTRIGETMETLKRREKSGAIELLFDNNDLKEEE